MINERHFTRNHVLKIPMPTNSMNYKLVYLSKNKLVMLFKKTYCESLRRHFEKYFGMTGVKKILRKGSKEKLHRNFYILEIPPGSVRGCWVYATIGMSLEFVNNQIELFIYSPQKDDSLVELLTVCASYHRNDLPLNLHHTVNIGRPWLKNSLCDHAFISRPYLEGESFEHFKYRDRELTHCYWLIPITKDERDYKIEYGCEALEQLFESNQLDYLNPARRNLILDV